MLTATDNVVLVFKSTQRCVQNDTFYTRMRYMHPNSSLIGGGGHAEVRSVHQHSISFVQLSYLYHEIPSHHSIFLSRSNPRRKLFNF